MIQTLTQRIHDEMKASMRNKDAQRLGVIRMAMAAIKQREVDERITLDDTQVLAVFDKMVKQRRDAQSQFEAAGRQDLADKEAYEITVIEEFLPSPLSEEEIASLIDKAIASAEATSPKDMGKVIGLIKPQAQGRADMGAVSVKVKAKLAAL